MSPPKRLPPARLAKAIGYEIKDCRLLQTALTHKSYVNENPMEHHVSNERLEFLGDAVLDLAISHALMKTHTGEPEGVLSRRRAALVNERSLAGKARFLGLGQHLLLGRGEERTHGRQKISLLANVYEALLGAIYLDGGFETALQVIQREFQEDLLESIGDLSGEDHKTRLQEFSQATFKVAPHYVLVDEKGPDHDKLFCVELDLSEGFKTTGWGKSKKEAEQRAARDMLERLQVENDSLPAGSSSGPDDSRTSTS